MGRPMKLTSKTYRIPVGCCNLIVIISFHEKTNTPYECFIKVAKRKLKNGAVVTGGCQANQGALADLITALLQNNALTDTVTALEGHFCSSCHSAKAKLSQEDKRDFPNSCADAVATVLKEWIKEEEEKNGKDKNVEPKKEDQK